MEQDSESYSEVRIELAEPGATGERATVKQVYIGNKHHTRIEWTDALTNRVLQLWRDGKSASEIADLVGVSSRSAIIGRIHRKGEARRAPPNIPKMTKAAFAKKRKPGLNIRMPTPAEKKQAAIVHDNVLSRIAAHRDVARIKFSDLETHHCRYPVGHPNDPDFGYCGEQAASGKPYCHAHATRCYQPERPRQEKSDLEIVE